MISVVIPYYQHSGGLLLRAVQSVLDQATDAAWNIIVIDDASPIPAERELEPLRAQLGDRLTLVRQPNGGASAARNSGLDCVGPDTEIVAFLDSDDTWEAKHLDRVMAAMRAGAEFYFENFQRCDKPLPRFSRPDFVLEAHRIFDESRELYWFEGDFFGALLAGSPAATPTIAYKFKALPDLRFRTDLSFCEDIFFWMEATTVLRKIAFSPRVGALVGHGLNISKPEWGSFELAKHRLSEFRYQCLVNSRFSHTPTQREYNLQARKHLSGAFWHAALAAALRGEYRCAPLMVSFLKAQPGAIRHLPPEISRLVQAKIRKRQIVPRPKV